MIGQQTLPLVNEGDAIFHLAYFSQSDDGEQAVESYIEGLTEFDVEQVTTGQIPLDTQSIAYDLKAQHLVPGFLLCLLTNIIYYTLKHETQRLCFVFSLFQFILFTAQLHSVFIYSYYVFFLLAHIYE